MEEEERKIDVVTKKEKKMESAQERTFDIANRSSNRERPPSRYTASLITFSSELDAGKIAKHMTLTATATLTTHLSSSSFAHSVRTFKAWI